MSKEKIRNTVVLTTSISCKNKEYLKHLKTDENINISRYIDSLITADKEKRKGEKLSNVDN